jgi:hypothetical protein
MKPFSPALAIGLVFAFLCGLGTHLLYERWNPSLSATGTDVANRKNFEFRPSVEPPSFRVTYLPASSLQTQPDTPPMPVREVEKIRKLAGSQAYVRGRVFRVGHSAKSNTYFLNFGPSREALTAVIFASAVEQFEKSKLQPKALEGKEVELRGEIKDHPQYGLELILETPTQIKVLD